MIEQRERRLCVAWFGQPTEHECARLAKAGWDVRAAKAEEPGGIGVHHGEVVVALADLRHASLGDMQALERLMSSYMNLPWVALVSPDVVVREPSAERILQASMDFLTAPLDMTRLIDTLMRVSDDHLFPIIDVDETGITGRSPSMQAVVASVRKYAPVELPVLITGETGTGKEVAARALHGLSARKERPFVAVNCGGLSPNLVQSELFGHERGSFTGANARHIGHFEMAAGGTVFLDEIGDLPQDGQTSLLRLLQEGTLERVGGSQRVKLDVRVLAATHVDLEKAVAQGRFREDLYYRLNVLRLRMPALREHVDDVELLAQQFLNAFRKQHHSHARTFGQAARQAMRSFAWPGNVRELKNRVQRAAVVAEGTSISVADLDLTEVLMFKCIRTSLGDARIAVERDTVLASLQESHFNVSECARRMKVSRVTIYRLCKKHQLALVDLR